MSDDPFLEEVRAYRLPESALRRPKELAEQAPELTPSQEAALAILFRPAVPTREGEG